MEKIVINKVDVSRIGAIDWEHISFGRTFSDHMLSVEFKEGVWQVCTIVPYGDIMLSPSSPGIHYGQSIFEGLKAHKNERDEVLVFRPEAHWERMNKSAERMCMPTLPKALFMEGMDTLLRLDKAWVPTVPGSSLYIRPFLFSQEHYIGVAPSENFVFMIITSPVGAYYAKPVRVRIETHYSRAARGGIGFVKTGGNYGGALYPARLAQQQGYQQLVWTDGRDHEYIEESGTMNIMFVIGDTLVTPPLNDSILAGITRDSILRLARDGGMNVEERAVSVKELIDGLTSGKVTDAFGTGTAATVAHIEAIGYDGQDYTLPPVEPNSFSHTVLEKLDGIKRGTRTDPYGWVHSV